MPFGIDQETAVAVTSSTGRVREVVVASVACGGALLTMGLIRPGGESFPRWGPVFGGRRVPVPLATVPAGAVAVVLTGTGFTLWRTLLAMLAGAVPGGEVAFDVGNWAAWLGNLAWLPWGLALGAATVAYRRRRRTAPAHD
ncbi:hypothetical protein [Nonomuraea diastatica]|uniref:hypothetical protein n=1 Tax=Nonomuraea diastatica TaxID=1848329 RepID=UPI001409ADDE|nr:hypothetical protein [Nonomuraea diastatica]